MKGCIRVLAGMIVIGATSLAHAAGSWSTQDYDLYAGDFNGDGLTDLLYISKDSSRPSGIVLSDGTGLNTTLQTWGNAYLGIPWTSGQYNVIVADFDGDGKADILLQRKSPGDSYLLLTEVDGVGAISQTIAQNTAGIAWSADQHRIVAGDFNGDGKADLFFQSPDAKGLNAVVLADANGQFTASVPNQSWNDGYAGLNWAQTESNIYAADFNGDGRSDLLIQADPIPGTGPGTLQPAQFAPNSNGVVLSRTTGVMFALEGLQAWSRNGFGADWSPLGELVVTGDFNGDGRADVLLQGQTANDTSYLVYGRTTGAIFTTAVSQGVSTGRSADTYLLLVGQFTHDKGNGLYAQSRSTGQTNQLARVTTSGIAVTQADASLPIPASNTLPAAPRNGPVRAAVVAPTSAGRTAGQFAVSAMGAATYQIPIWTPPGARGIEPHLAITYASGSPDGNMGPGWSLSGLSSIARCNKTYAENGAPAAVALTTTDDYCMDGNRLRLTSGSYGISPSTYQTEIANFSNITAYGSAVNGPSYFIVQGKDGLYYEYGNSADSKAYALNGSVPYAWMLNKVRDRQGNNLIIVYATTSGSVAPSSIQYTQTPSTNGTTYPYTVSFSYQARVTNLSRYVGGQNIQQTQVLTKVNVQSSGVSVRQYNMTYGTAPTTIRDRLSSIQECAGSAGTDCLRATTVTYQDGSAGASSATSATGSGTTVTGTLNTADIDGDGKEDLLYATASGTTYIWWVQFATSSGYSAPVNTGATTPTSSGVLLDDFLSEGRNSLLAPNAGVWWLYRWNGTSFVGTATTSTALASPTSALYSSADVDGDGRPDLVYLDLSHLVVVNGVNSYGVTIQVNTTSGSTPSFAAPVVGQYIAAATAGGFQLRGNNQNPQSSVLHMDFNGDGRDDLVISYWAYIYPFGTFDVIQALLSRGSTFTLGTNFTLPYAVPIKSAPVRWNDDGCTDLQAQNVVKISQCDGSYAADITLPGIPDIIMDWDGDGRTDALINVGGVWQLSRSLGTTVATAVSTGLSVGTGNWIVTDQNGDGLGDFAFADSTTSYALKYGLHNGASTPADLATTISDGWGISASPTYVPASQNNHTKGASAVFPEMDFNGPMYVVSQASQSDGLGSTFNNTFWYYGARINRQGRGFEGFSETRSQDSRNSLYQFVYYNQTYPYTGTVVERDTTQSNGTSLIAKTVNHFSVTDLGGVGCTNATTSASSRCFPWLDTATSTSYEISSGTPLIQTSVSAFTFDSYGNPLTASTTTTDNDSNSPDYNGAWTSLVTNTYLTDTTNWCLDKTTRTTTQNTVPGQASQTRTVDHAVDAANCRFTSETVEPLSTTLKAVTSFGYDTCGNVNSVGVAGLDKNGATMPTRTTSSSYGTRCTFPESVTNALSQISYTSYNYSYGTKASSTDPNSVAVSWLYDNFGRRNRESRPDSTYTTWTYTDCTADPCWGVPNLRFLAQASQYDSGSTLIRTVDDFYDGLERPRYHEYNRALGVWTNEVTYYDALGRRSTVYLPFSSASNGYHAFGYDLLNRPTSDQLYDNAGTLNRTTGMAYAGLKTTITDARTSSTTKWMDVAGKLRRIVDPAPGGTTNYTYDPFGNLTTIVDAKLPTGATTSYAYNIRGFKTDSTDPDTGHWIYTPDSLNELVQQTDAKSQVTSFGYDLLGRMTSRLEPESTTATTWTYGTSAALHEIGRAKSVSKPDGYAEGYTYDSVGRPAGTTITEDTNYAIGYAYNALGAVDTVTYPASTGSPFVLKYLYSYGVLQQVKDNAAGTVFWSLSAANDSSLPMTEVLGNGVNVSSTYTPWTNELNTRQEGTGGVANSLQDLTYTWDPNGNLQQRKDQKQLPNQTEIFVHDALNRVSSSTLNGTTNLTVGYDEAGNITSKSDVGTYDYSTAQSGCTYQSYAQPHAVRKAGTAVYCYDANGNATSRQGGALAWTSYNLPSSISQTGTSNGPTTWTNVVNATTSNSTGSFISTSSTYLATATSQQTIGASGGSFSFQTNMFSATSNPTGVLAGLGSGSTLAYNWNVQRLTNGQIDAEVRESGTYRTDIILAAGDTLSVNVEGGAVKYYRNSTLVYTSTVAPTFPLAAIAQTWSNGFGLTQSSVTTSGGGGNSTAFSYNSSHQRWKQDANYAGVHEVTYYIGGVMEKTTKGTGATEYRHLIPAGSGSAILTRRSDLTNSTYYMTSDHLGSGDLVLDSSANILAKESFTPFGARRGSNWQGIPTTADYTVFSNTSRRGFTGHEMLDSVGLVHMNGRVYDPTIGRFLSADPIIQTLALSQAINAFSYVMNMPLTLTDPSGMSWLSKLFGGIGSFLKKYGSTIIQVVFTVVGMPFIGALLGSLFNAAVNGGTIGGFLTGLAISAAAGAIAGPIGGKLGGLISKGASEFVAKVIAGAVTGAIAGGISSAASGGSFWSGAAVGAITGGLTAGLQAKYGTAPDPESQAARLEAEVRGAFGVIWTLPTKFIGWLSTGVGQLLYADTNTSRDAELQKELDEITIEGKQIHSRAWIEGGVMAVLSAAIVATGIFLASPFLILAGIVALPVALGLTSGVEWYRLHQLEIRRREIEEQRAAGSA